MKTQLFAISLLAVSVLSGGSSANAQKKNALMADFEKTGGKFIEWFNAGKMDSLSALYLETTCMIPDNLPAINNRENVKDYYQELFDNGFRFTEIKSSGYVTGDNIIVERGTWSAIIQDHVQLSGTYLSQWQYTNKQWQIENEMSNVVSY